MDIAECDFMHVYTYMCVYISFNTSLEVQVNINFENRSYKKRLIYQLNLQMIRLIPWNKKEQDSPLKKTAINNKNMLS